MAGVRSGKTVTTIDTSTGEITGTTEYKYTTLSGKLVRVEYNTTILDIVYDESGQPFSIRYKSSPTATGALYYYVLNAQGDVVGLLNSSGELVVEYKYDPWGKLLETIIGVDETDSKYAAYNNMGLRNPLRYRGYIYDRETGFYYLQSRYYDPAICRFINADAYITTNTLGLLNTNMYTYCEDNPISNFDFSGNYSFLCRELDREKTAKNNYNTQTVNIFVSGIGASVKGKVNVCLYETTNSTYMNMSIDKSLQINSTIEINAVIDVIMKSKYYDENVYGSKSFMRGQWLAHNMCYNLAISSDIGYKIACFIAGSDNIIDSSKSLDLRPLDNVTKRGKIIYTILGLSF